MLWILGLLALGLFGYAVYVQYEKADPSTPAPMRVWVAVSGAFAAFGAFVMQWFS